MNKIIIVTEKDASRLVSMEIDETVKFSFYYLTIEVKFLDKSHEIEFDKKILEHVEENTRDNRVYKETN